MSFKYHDNPSQLSCFQMCRSCFRCSDKGSMPACNSCSGRHDPELKREPHDQMDRCRCAEGIMQYRLQNGRLMVRKFMSDPFGGKVVTDAETQDERDWSAYITEQRERMDDPDWDPIVFDDDGTPVRKRLAY